VELAMGIVRSAIGKPMNASQLSRLHGKDKRVGGGWSYRILKSLIELSM
jgi:hypothetical protein